jgi:GMP synthase-like glutamine amidotransferase
MALLHPADGLEGVQFHPESVGTPDGLALARNVVAGFAGRPPRKELYARSYSP